jgi:hypothetical protein
MEPPVLSSPPAFVVLAIIMAVSAYLYSVTKTRDSEIDDIEDGKLEYRYPPGSTERADRLEYLKWSRKRLGQVAWIMIVATIALSMRLVAIAIHRLPPSGSGLAEIAARYFDLIFLLAMTATFCFLWYFHMTGRERSDEIRRRVSERRDKSKASS